MTHLARQTWPARPPGRPACRVPAWALVRVAWYLKTGMSKSAIEQGDSSGAIKLLSPAELKLPTKAPVAFDDYYTMQAVLHCTRPRELAWAGGDSAFRDQRSFPDEVMETKIQQELEAKYARRTLDDGRKDEQCIYRNGKSFHPEVGRDVCTLEG